MKYPSSFCVYVATYRRRRWSHYSEVGFKSSSIPKWRGTEFETFVGFVKQDPTLLIPSDGIEEINAAAI